MWPTFLPNGHFLTAWYSNSIREDSISPTSSSPWAITWQYTSAFGRSSSLSRFFAMLLISWDFLLCLIDFYILLRFYLASLASGCLYVFVSSPPICWKNFLSLFWNVLFCLYCSYPLSISCFATTFSSCLVIFPFAAFSFFPNKFQRFSFVLSFLHIFKALSAFSVEFPIQVLIFLVWTSWLPFKIIHLVK